jgi:integrase
MELNEITPLFIEKYRAKRLKTGVSKSTVNRDLAIMKKMFNLSIDWKLATENPVKKVKFFSEKDNLKERILTKEEEDRLLVASAEHLKPILIAALNTGMRLGEILSLKWGQIDFEKELVRVEKTKSGKIRYVNINSVLSKTLENLKAQDGEFLFTNPETGQPLKDVKTAFKSACRRANIKNLRFHDLRHTFATRLVESGVDIITVKELLGHSTVKITERYTHPNQKLKEKAVELLAKRPEKSDDLAHICHTERKKKSEKHVTDSISVN